MCLPISGFPRLSCIITQWENSEFITEFHFLDILCYIKKSLRNTSLIFFSWVLFMEIHYTTFIINYLTFHFCIADKKVLFESFSFICWGLILKFFQTVYWLFVFLLKITIYMTIFVIYWISSLQSKKCGLTL